MTHFHAIFSDNLAFLPCPEEFSGVPNYLNFFITGLKKCYNSFPTSLPMCLSQVITKFLCLPYHVFFIIFFFVLINIYKTWQHMSIRF